MYGSCVSLVRLPSVDSTWHPLSTCVCVRHFFVAPQPSPSMCLSAYACLHADTFGETSTPMRPPSLLSCQHALNMNGLQRAYHQTKPNPPTARRQPAHLCFERTRNAALEFISTLDLFVLAPSHSCACALSSA